MASAAESVTEALKAAGVPFDTSKYDVAIRRLTDGHGNFTSAAGERFGETPMASCLMVTRGDVDQIAFAMRCYRAQTWAQRELVVVAPAAAVAPIERLAADLGAPNVKVFAAPSALTLGDLRNFAIARATGDVLFQWDDDDLYDPLRIALTISVLQKNGAAAALLERWLVWWPARRTAAISRRRTWEGSIGFWRAHAPIYPALHISEDSHALEHLYATRAIATFDAPLQYIYTVSGRNTWGVDHFEYQLATADVVFEGERYDALNALLAQRLPVLEYERFILSLDPVRTQTVSS